MAVSFDKINIGQEYERPFLAKLWGYKSYQAISRGVITPAETDYIILFVTKEKQQSQIQYNDYIRGEILFWDGENKHGSDERIIRAFSNNDQIHLFYRSIHHTPFVYYGEIHLLEYQQYTNQPSKFQFSILNTDKKSDSLGDNLGIHKRDTNGPIASNDLELSSGFEKIFDALDDLEMHKGEYLLLDKTVRADIVKSRIGQGKFRKNLIKFWGSCSITGLSNTALLKASHIKPWRDCSNLERLDPMNGLLLHPTYDHLFDAGFISFDNDGKILISEDLSETDTEILHISIECRLRKLPSKVLDYMKYHREFIFRRRLKPF